MLEGPLTLADDSGDIEFAVATTTPPHSVPITLGNYCRKIISCTLWIPHSFLACLCALTDVGLQNCPARMPLEYKLQWESLAYRTHTSESKCPKIAEKNAYD